MTHVRLLPIAVLGLGCALLAGAADAPNKPSLPDPAYGKLIEPSVKLIEASLAGEPTKRAAEKARVAALMLAEFAQQNLAGADAAQRATVRDAALDIAALVKDKKYADAVKQAQGLAKLPAKPDAKKERVKIFGDLMELDELMGQFRGCKVGGLGIETLFDKLSASKDGVVPAAALTEELQLTAWRTAVAAELARDHVPKMAQKDWLAYADSMQKSARELADAATARNGKAALEAVNRLNLSCNQCHQKFR